MSGVTMKHDIPEDSVILVGETRSFDYADSFSVSLQLEQTFTIDYLTAKVFSFTPAWVAQLMQLRNALVARFGLKTDTPEPFGEIPRDIRLEPGVTKTLFTVSHRNQEEVVMAEQDRHLDFRVSVRCSATSNNATDMAVTTCVWFNNVWGRLYFVVVKPFHQLIIRSMLRRAAARLQQDSVAASGSRAAFRAQRMPLRRSLASLVAVAGGLLVTGMGVAHFPMAYDVANSPPFMALSPSARDWPILLCLCVGLLLIFVGALSVYFAPRLGRGERGARLFFSSVGVLLLCRTALELLHPVTILDGESNVALSLFLTSLAFFVPVLLSSASRGRVLSTDEGNPTAGLDCP